MRLLEGSGLNQNETTQSHATSFMAHRVHASVDTLFLADDSLATVDIPPYMLPSSIVSSSTA